MNHMEYVEPLTPSKGSLVYRLIQGARQRNDGRGGPGRPQGPGSGDGRVLVHPPRRGEFV